MNIDWIEKIEEDKRESILRRIDGAKSEIEINKVLYHYHPEGIVNEKKIRFLNEFLECIRELTNSYTWFRGESKQNDFLIPKLYRNRLEDDLDAILNEERVYFEEFRRRAKSIVSNVEFNDFWSWYFLIQHYGGPTRLLDWTSNPLVALFMSLDSDKSDDPVIYFLQPTILTSYALKDINVVDHEAQKLFYPGQDRTDNWIKNITEKSVNIPNSPIALLPTYSDPRIVSQKSCFTLFGKRLNGFAKDGKQIVCDCCEGKIIHRLIIDSNYKENLRSELAKIGFSSETIYPGLEGLIMEMNQELKRN